MDVTANQIITHVIVTWKPLVTMLIGNAAKMTRATDFIWTASTDNHYLW